MYTGGHGKNDLYSLRLHKAIVAKLRANPDVVLEKAKATLELRRHRPNEAYYVREWERLLYGPLETLLATMVDESEYATALRQATPFSGILRPEESQLIHRAVIEEWQHASR